MDYQKYFDIADKVVNIATDFLSNNFGDTKPLNHKTDTHYGIDDDKTVDKIYTDFLSEVTPEIALYTEEGTKNYGDLTWVVDPIEGTSNYRVGNPFFATQITLLENMKPVVSIVNAPVLKQKFRAIKNNGAFLNDKRINVADTDHLNKSLISIGKGTKPEHLKWVGAFLPTIMNKVRTARIMGSTGLEMAYTSSGIFDAHVNFGSQLYDYAPASLLIKESGGVVLNKSGNEWSVTDDFLIAGNSKLTTEILKIIV